MPFTFAHPSIVIPLRKMRLILSALIIGSMTPDIEYFITFKFQNNYGHHLLGVLYFCIPVGLIIVLLFHQICKYPLFLLLPVNIQSRLYEDVKKSFSFFPFKRLLLIIISLAIGAFSHILWDSFTHRYGFFVLKYDCLSNILYKNHFFVIRLYKLLQHLSTGIGFGMIAFFFNSWYKRASKKNVPIGLLYSASVKRWILRVLIFIPLLLSLLITYHQHNILFDVYRIHGFIALTALHFVSFFLMFVFVYSVFISTYLKRRNHLF